MVITDRQAYDEIWDKVYDILKFSPSYYDQSHSMQIKLPFQINRPYVVYGIENMTEAQTDLLNDTIRDIFIRITGEGKRIYALDWQHSAFLYDPGDISEQQSQFVKDGRYSGGGYNAYFPSFYPDGDYYLFIEESFEFGYLGHPWRQEIWVFGEKLITEIGKVYDKFGWEIIWDSQYTK
ncbi:MAG: DUF2716 domain-containing protein [Oscillospiraceae bacterium]|nr:DUF2716 domain-containing protein [Oscillospiraceae bacterium]